jgi:hypothetical protein
MVIRPLTVRTLWSARPLFCRRWPLAGSVGGKSRFRGIDTQLQGRLIDGRAEVGDQIADRFLAVVEDLAEGRSIDGQGDIAAELLEAAAEGGDKNFRGDRG